MPTHLTALGRACGLLSGNRKASWWLSAAGSLITANTLQSYLEHNMGSSGCSNSYEANYAVTIAKVLPPP